MENTFRKLFDLSGSVALITGAGVGFGEQISLAFAEYGCDIAASDLDIENPQRTAERVRQKGRRAIALQANVAVPGDVVAMVDATVRELGGIDILVNCAGIPQHDPRKVLRLKPGIESSTSISAARFCAVRPPRASCWRRVRV